jgi:hypothetical protein
VEEVLAEASRAHGLREVHVRGGDEAHVHLDRTGAPDALELPLLHHAEELGLEREAEVLDLVEVERPSRRHLDLARLGRAGVREGAALVAEELGLEEVGGDARAVDLDERAVAPRSPVVEPVCDEVLAGAALPLEEHRALRLGEPGDDGHELPHRRRLRHHLEEPLLQRLAHPASSTRVAAPHSRSRS